MTPGEFKEFAKSMKEFDISYVKMGDVILRRQGGEAVRHLVAEAQNNLPEGITTEPSDPIAHKVEQLTSLAKLSDTDLVDRLFPDHTEDSA